MVDTIKPGQHIQQVDYIRAIASMAVALFHLGGKTLPVLNYGWLGVQMFFLLSGFIICWAIPVTFTPKTSFKFIIRRIIRIEPPYILSIALLLLLNYLTLPVYQADWLSVLFHLGYINSFLNKEYLNPVYWTLGIEFQFYIFIALFYPLIISRWGKWLLLGLCLIPLLITISGHLLLGVFPLFAIGIMYNLYLKKQVSAATSGLFIMIFLAVATWHLGWLQMASGLLALLILLLPLKSNSIVSFLSKISFSLYLTHDIVGSRLVVYIGTQLPKTFFYKGVEFITGIIVSLAFAWLFYRLVEAPFFRWSKKISYG